MVTSTGDGIFTSSRPPENLEERKDERGERQREEGGAGLLLLHAGRDGDGDVLVRGVDNRRAGEDRGVGDTRALSEEDCEAATKASDEEISRRDAKEIDSP